jgi:indole-3-glycerol phosphate synthase
MTAGVLDAIVAGCARSAALRERALDARAFQEAWSARHPRGDLFEASLREPGIRVIAECKRRSPAKGILRRAYDPVAIARSYEAAGAAAISVLTEPTFFDGSIAHLTAVRAAVETPVLRKDFLTTGFELLEARAAGADAVLLIVAALDDAGLRSLLDAAHEVGMDALVEVHDGAELERALEAGARLVGVNNRDLRTLAVSLETSLSLAERIPDDVVAVAESGIRTGSDLRRLREAGFDASLIGEHLMSAPDPGTALRRLLEEAS